MDNREKPDIAEQVAAALNWWRDAGVDCDFVDEPVDWLAPPPAPGAAPAGAATDLPAPATPRPVRFEVATATSTPVDTSVWPATLAEFAPWWLSEPSLDGGRIVGRVPPRGPAAAELMVIVEQPEEADSEILLSAREGRLLDAILAATGIAAEQVYVASVLPRHTPMPDWSEVAAQGFGKLLACHVALVAPKRLIAFGANILPLAGHDLPNKPATLTTFNHEDASIQMLATYGLSMLLDRPQWKARFWHGWLEGSR